MRRPGPDLLIWDRSVPLICWPRNGAVLQLSGDLIYGVAEGSSTHGMAEPEMTEHGDL
jgi:hypothetical protein